MTYIPNPQEIEGGQVKTVVTDWNTQQLLGDVLRELKKMNIHLELLTNENITDKEINNA